MKALFYCFALFFLPWAVLAGEILDENEGHYTVRVNQDTGKDDQSCVQHQHPCKSLEMVSKQFQEDCSGLTVFIEGEVHVNSLISFKDCTYLRFLGEVRPALISCEASAEGAGFQFEHVVSLTITGLKLEQCGYRLSLIEFDSMAAMHIHCCINVTLEEITFQNSVFTALVFSDTSDKVTIKNSYFLNSSNYPSETVNASLYPGGLHIQFSTSSPSKYTVINSYFKNNTQVRLLNRKPRISLTPRLSTEYGYGLGGGMGALFRKNSHNISLLIYGCDFVGNRAHSGAGLYVHFEEDTDGNSVDIVNSHFVGNSGTAGGGLTVGMDKLMGTGNTLSVSGCEIVSNKAEYGAGTTVFLIHTDSLQTATMKLVKFHNSTWRNNVGFYSPAVDILPFRADQFNSGYLPAPLFTNCTFSNNAVISRKSNATIHLYSGAFVASSTSVYFGGTIKFFSNQYTALKLTSGRLHLERGADVYFDSNVGHYGGAIGLYGFSAVIGNENCLLHFHNNSASILGGGIYYETIEQREFIEGKSCFLQNAALNNTEKSFKLIFVNNSASYGGTSIHAISFYSCYFAYLRDLKKYSLKDFLMYIGTFEFKDSDDTRTALGTEGMQFHYNSLHRLTAVPGEAIQIPISIGDEFNQTTQSMLFLRRENDEIRTSTIFSYSKTTVFGKQLEKAFLLLMTENTIRSSYIKLSLEFMPCPPGFYFDSKTDACHCRADNIKYNLSPIVKCNHSLFRAYILAGYWAGMYTHNNVTNLYVSSYGRLTPFYDTSVYSHLRLLPKTEQEMVKFMCGKRREGVLCGQCRNGYATFYHSKSYKCGMERYCHLGITFFVISELIPVVILFSFIIHYNVRFQSGYLNGFIFYCQVVSVTFVNLDKLGNTLSSEHTAVKIFQYLQQMCRLLYNVFNFEFFGIEPLSFCLWKGGKVMDIIFFKYMTTLFTFVLVFILVRVMNSKCFTHCRRKIRVNESVASGLSAFLILCYSQCTKISFQILTRETIISDETEISVTQYGGLPYFGAKHLVYAIPALTCLLTLISLPVLYLLAVPLVLRISSMCELSEHKVVSIFLTIFCQHKLMPLLDAFQSCFKPELRFFAGVYFAYRIAIFAVLTFSKNETELHAVTELVFLLILGFHSIAQPYKEKNINMIDSFLFLNLAIINGLNILVTVSSANYYNRNTGLLLGLISVQLLLVLLPLIGIATALCVLRFRKSKHALQEASYEEIRDITQESSLEDNTPDNLTDTY